MGRILIKKRKKEMGITVDKSSLNYNHNNLKKTYNRYRNPRSLTIMLFTGLTLCGIIIYLLIAGQTETESSAVSENALKDFEINSRFHTYEVLYEYPHDREAFTQGLEYSGNDTLYESTGLNGRSSVREVNLQTGKVQRLHQMKDADFGEGLTLLAERLFQLTWLTNVGYIYDQFNFSKVKRFRHPMKDGWGLANDGKNLFGSDGSSTMYYLDPVTFKERYRVTVKYEGLEVFHLNELEFINGEVWANVWQSDCIARISPKDGIVLGWILFHKLRKNLISSGYKSLDVLNGIAWDKGKGRLFVTGKLWPKLYQIKVRPLSQQEIKNLVWSSVFNILSFSAFTQFPSLKEYALLQFLVNLLHEGPKR